jgi:hypothetical protein
VCGEPLNSCVTSRDRTFCGCPRGKYRWPPALLLPPHEALSLEVAKDGEHGGIHEVHGKLILHLGDRAGGELPEHGHDVELALAEGGINGTSGHGCSARRIYYVLSSCAGVDG